MKPLPGGSRRLGLFGGSFDPVHAGHLHAARAALEGFALDRVVFVPARRPPHKPARVLASGEDRMEMLRLATADEARFLVLGLELAREGPSYTIDTVRALPTALGEAEDVSIYLILGSDNLEGLSSWRDAAALLERVQPVVVHRPGDAEGAIGRTDPRLGEDQQALAEDQRTLDEDERTLGEIERTLGRSAADKLRSGYLRLPPVPVSSTGIRARLAEFTASLPGLGEREVELPPAVLDYIRKHGLYGAAG